ncbi:MAG: glycosyltransferase [Hyphomicrobiales bacterium]
MRNKIVVLANWTLVKYNEGSYVLSHIHYKYLEYISQKFETVLIAPVISNKSVDPDKFVKIDSLNVQVEELPFVGSYIKSLLYWRSYYRAISKYREYELFYCRIPDPFSWMPKIIFKRNCIMHFVGDTIDATKHNEKWSWIKKKFMILGYLPDYWLTLRSARKSKVFTNGFHIAEKLKDKKIDARAVISSSVQINELNNHFSPLNENCISLIYIGYLRYAKGIKTIMNTILRLKALNLSFSFDIVGQGEMFVELNEFVEDNGLNEIVTLHGHVDNRVQLNELLRKSDMFFFPSLSEGSPRVVIEAMSQGVPVMSTPVGSIPFVFKDRRDIRLFDYNDVDQAVDIIQNYLSDNSEFCIQRERAFDQVKENYTIEKFLDKVFSNET